ncbi:MAG: DnaJ domain-containing protein [Methanosphaera sp.]|nr:DnaJ domain-containing protein [Methanosphaera sp.]
MNPKRNYYKILKVKMDADNKSIKKAYKKLALKYHPDVNPSENAEKKFRILTEAYNVLIDKQKRKEYDHKRASLIRKQAQIKKNELKIKEGKQRHRRQARRKNNISKYVKLAGQLERDYGLVSSALGLVVNNSSLKRGKGSPHNSSALNIVSNLLSTASSSHKGHKHRYRGDRY